MKSEVTYQEKSAKVVQLQSSDAIHVQMKRHVQLARIRFWKLLLTIKAIRCANVMERVRTCLSMLLVHAVVTSTII